MSSRRKREEIYRGGSEGEKERGGRRKRERERERERVGIEE